MEDDILKKLQDYVMNTRYNNYKKRGEILKVSPGNFNLSFDFASLYPSMQKTYNTQRQILRKNKINNIFKKPITI